MENNKEHYDVGIFGVWSGCNYGSVATYYALNQVVSAMGKSVLMIDKPLLSDNDPEIKENHARRFAREHYNISRQYRLDQMHLLNQNCDTFMIGSDQVWNYGISKNFGKAFYLDFAEEEKKKIAYAVSFGHGTDFAPYDERKIIAEYMSYFDGIGTREADGVRLCRDCYGIKAEQVIDPVFLADPKIYDSLIEKSSKRETEPFIVAYILDPSPEKTEAILHLQKEFGGIKVINLLDGLPWLFEKNKKLTNLPNCIENVQVEDWLYYLKNAEFVLTDSCHGASFALIFRKNFIAIANRHRGFSRFISLAQLFKFENHLITVPKDVVTNPKLLASINYDLVEDIMDSERRRCYTWLYNVISLPKKSEKELKKYNVIGEVNQETSHIIEKPTNGICDEKTVLKIGMSGKCNGCGICESICDENAIKIYKNENKVFFPFVSRNRCVNCGKCLEKCSFNKLESGDEKNTELGERQKLFINPDFIKIRLLATLLRDYGIKEIVLSPGGRDVPLVRMFEYNSDTFNLHFVTDERSAAYFGLGLATQLGRPVACVCTSGTAASNYLPAVTEAFFTHIPMIFITADRQKVYHGQGEDQTIPQDNIYSGVVKREITVPEGSGYKVEYQTRRDICDCILESTHNVPGPVHINMAIDNITIGGKLPREDWKLLPTIKPHILRTSFNDGYEQINKWRVALAKSKRILVVYGQNAPRNEEQLKYIDLFVGKYNCVVVTDLISNLNCNYSLKPYNMLQAISKEQFDRELTPDILITVGGKRLMNDPLTSKIRGGDKKIRHWSVSPDGVIHDFYFRLSSVIEMSQDLFFKFFSEFEGELSNDGKYYNKWREFVDKYDSPVIRKFNSQYIQSKFLPAIPSNSILHLGVGLSFYDCRRFSLNNNVAVYCNMGTNGIDGCTSTFMGQCAVEKNRLCFLLVGDLSFFYDMNSIWNKQLTGKMRILLVNNNGTGLLRNHRLKGISSVHNTKAEGWVKSTGFEYISAESKDEFDSKLAYFLDESVDKPLFFEVLCE